MEKTNTAIEATSSMNIFRPCGRHETYSTARHYLGFYNNVGLTATYTTSTDPEKSLETLVFTALHHVIAEHPNLSAMPMHEGRSYPDVYFARLHEIDLGTCVQFHHRKTIVPQGDETDGELDKLLREQHDRNFEGDIESRPFWRLIVASSPGTPRIFTASWIFHHALSDGASSMLFHESFLEGLNIVAVQKDVSPIVKTPSAPLSQALEELHSMTLSWSFFLRAVAGSLLPSYFAARPPNLWTGYPIDAIVQTPVPSHNTTIVLSTETTRAFAEKCRAERTSVTAALSTLLAAIIFPWIHPQNEVRIDTPISLRPFLDVSRKQMVNAITNHAFTFSRSTDLPSVHAMKNFSWDTARLVKSELVKEVEKKGADNPIALLKFVPNMSSYFVEKLGLQRYSSAEVSNLGVWCPHASGGDENNGRWSLGRMTFTQSLNRTGPQISLSAVTGGDRCLVLSFNWPQEFVQFEREGGENELYRVPQMMKAGIEKLVTGTPQLSPLS